MKRQLKQIEKASSDSLERLKKEALLNVRSLESNVESKVKEIMLDINKISRISEDLAFQDTTIIDLKDRFLKIEDFTKDIQENGFVTATHVKHHKKRTKRRQ